MRLTIVGCSGSYPGPDSAASCYLVEADGFQLVLDLGNGALGALASYTDIYAVDAVALSHLHVDHCVDLTSFYVARKYRPQGPLAPLPVYGPAGTRARLTAAYGTESGQDMGQQFDFTDHADVREVGPFTLRTVRVAHLGTAYALRVEHGGRALVFSGDTAPCDALTALAGGADLLLSEASFQQGDQNPPDLHLTGAEAGRHATAAGVGQLVLTHVPPWHSRQRAAEEAAATWAGPLSLAACGQWYDL